jgi:hypothetical protein
LKYDGFAKSPSADGQSGFSANADASAPIIASQLYVTAAYLYVRLIPQLSQALHLEPFALPSGLREIANSPIKLPEQNRNWEAESICTCGI